MPDTFAEYYAPILKDVFTAQARKELAQGADGLIFCKLVPPFRCHREYWLSRISRAQPLPLRFVKTSRTHTCFHQEFFIAFDSLFFTRLRGD